MADSNIGALPQAPSLADDSLMVVEQQGTAMKMTGAQFKEFGKQGVMQDVQDLVDEAQAAANSAESAVSSVVDMTVEASTLDNGAPATVTKTIKQGKVNLAFGLPRGAQGIPGPKGDTGDPGQKGPKGDPGAGLDIAGRYDTTSDVSSPQEGKSYYIGTSAPYDLYTYLDGEWVNNGPISGGGGGVIPEDVVTSEGGASFEYGTGTGDAPHVITITTEEEPPLTAEDVNYSDTQTVKGAIDDLKSSVSNGKNLVASAITDKGVPTAQDATFAQMAENIGQISTGADTSDATATAGDILYGKTAYTASGKVTGSIPSLGAQTITPGTTAKSISSGQYLSGPQTIAGDTNLTSANIKKGVSIFGVTGAVESSFKATLTVKVDTGAVVTATSGDKSISALSTSGTVVLELPAEGTWSVTAARGTTQYNTAIVTVTSSYSAELIAEIYIEYFGQATALSVGRSNLAGCPAPAHWHNDVAIFAGGTTYTPSTAAGTTPQSNAVDAYDSSLARTSLTNLNQKRQDLVGVTAVGLAGVAYALFAGGWHYANVNTVICDDTVDCYGGDCEHSYAMELSAPRAYLGAAEVGGHVLFAGGSDPSTNASSSVVDAYDSVSLTRSSAPILSSAYSETVGRSTPDGKHALFANLGTVNSYDEDLVRTVPAKLGVARSGYEAATAGSYTLFAGGNTTSAGSIVDAYDLFLTRTTPQALPAGRNGPTGATLDGYAILTGGIDPSSSSGYVYQTGTDVYNAQLVRTSSDAWLAAEGSAASVVGDYALFAGGAIWTNGSSRTNLDIAAAFTRVA